jgi:hypothetical protein
MMLGVKVVGMSDLSVMGGLFMIAILVRLSGFSVMLGGVFVVFGRLVVMR